MKTVIVLLAALVALSGARSAAPPSADDERARVRAHLEGVLEQLRTSPPAGLDAPQRAARAETIEWLAEYTERGRYPHNHVTAVTSPIFVDPHGTPCAVGYLLLRSGEHALVDRIVRTDNRVRVAQLAGDEQLGRWLRERGITLEEAARIQPVYEPAGDPGRDPGVSPFTAVSIGVSALTAGVSMYAVSAGESARAAGWVEPLAVAGVVGHGALLMSLYTRDEYPGWAPWVHGAGVLLGALTLRAATAPNEPEPGERSIQVAPILAPDRFGLTLRW
ncbi:hypothetical protein V3331_09905 [Gaopeijia maritima]|uniref:hypothetical protein n=1 Tax=Gaopeijia maritima TaxID=3119007 RepID=UPI0032536008